MDQKAKQAARRCAEGREGEWERGSLKSARGENPKPYAAGQESGTGGRGGGAGARYRMWEAGKEETKTCTAPWASTHGGRAGQSEERRQSECTACRQPRSDAIDIPAPGSTLGSLLERVLRRLAQVRSSSSSCADAHRWHAAHEPHGSPTPRPFPAASLGSQHLARVQARLGIPRHGAPALLGRFVSAGPHTLCIYLRPNQEPSGRDSVEYRAVLIAHPAIG